MSVTPSQQKWNGIYYDGVSATAYRVTVQVAPTGMHITARSGGQLSWQYQDVRQTQGRHSGEEIRFERGNGICETLVVSDHGILTCLHKVVPEKVQHFHNPAKRRRRLLLTVCAGLLSIPLFWAIFQWGIPWISSPLTTFVPRAWEEQLGQFMVTRLAPPAKQCTNPEVAETLNTIIQRLDQTDHDHPYTFHVYVVDRPIVNALAAPGGHLIVFRGLLEKTENATEMAGILAHEMQHVLQRHGMRLMIQHISVGFAVGALSGDVSGIMTFGLQAAQVLQSLSYNRAAEEEADRQGIALLTRSGIDPKGLMHFLETLTTTQEPRALPEYLSTHPSTDERLQRLQSLISTQSESPIALLPEKDWSQIREMCMEEGK